MTKQPSKLSRFLTEITEPYLAFLRGLTPALLFFVLYMVMTEYIKDGNLFTLGNFLVNSTDFKCICCFIRCHKFLQNLRQPVFNVIRKAYVRHDFKPLFR